MLQYQKCILELLKLWLDPHLQGCDDSLDSIKVKLETKLDSWSLMKVI